MATVTHEIVTAATAASPLTSGAFTPAANDLLVVFVVATATTAAAGTLTSSAGLTFTKVTTATKVTTVDIIYLFVSNEPAAASSQTVTFDASADPTTGQIIFVCGVAGMSMYGGAAVRQSAVQNNGAAAGTPAPVFAVAALTGNPCLGCVGNATNPAGMTQPASWTEGVADSGYATPTTGGEYVFINSGFTGTTVTWGSTSATAFGAIVVELNTSLAPTSLIMGSRLRP